MPIIFCLLIIFCFWLSHQMRKNDEQSAKQSKEFWDLEQKANFTRKQNTDDLVRITLPDTLIFHPDSTNTELAAIEDKIKDTCSHEIINLTGISNTELKLKYGLANLDYLSECDGYFTRLVCQLKEWSKLLYKQDLINDCCKVLDFAISINADVTDIYLLRAKIYLADNDSDGVNHLIECAARLNTIRKNSIMDKLSQLLSDNIIDSITSND